MHLAQVACVATQDLSLSSDLHCTLRTLIRTPGLNERQHREPQWCASVLGQLARASALAWDDRFNVDDASPTLNSVRLATQRALYELNRSRFYWFDDPDSYRNECSPVLLALQSELEAPWQRWLARLVVNDGMKQAGPSDVLRMWAHRDLTPPVHQDESWFAKHVNLTGYRRLLEIASLNGLVEASQLSRVLGGPAHPVQATLFRILMEEYGAGRPQKKHAQFFAHMLEQQGLSTQPEAYFERAPWQVLSAINHSFYLTENRRHYLRFCGAFTYTELSTPIGFHGYAAAAKRLGLSDGQSDYWALHVREDERHGAWMVNEVALPLIQQFPAHAADVLFGYAQQRLVEGMAAAAVERACRSAHEEVVSA
jgi:hypothetical protein